MTLEQAEILSHLIKSYNSCEESAIIIPEYSGRGMYEETTVAIEITYRTSLIPALLKQSDYLSQQEMEILSCIDNLNIDRMKSSMVVY